MAPVEAPLWSVLLHVRSVSWRQLQTSQHPAVLHERGRRGYPYLHQHLNCRLEDVQRGDRTIWSILQISEQHNFWAGHLQPLQLRTEWNSGAVYRQLVQPGEELRVRGTQGSDDLWSYPGRNTRSVIVCIPPNGPRADPWEGENACETAWGSTGATVPSPARQGDRFPSQCSHKSVADIAKKPDTADHYNSYLNTIGADQATMGNCTIRVGGHEVPFKGDTGAEVTVISEEMWTSLHLSQLKPPTKQLHGPDGKPLKITSELWATLLYRGCQCTQPILVVKHLQHNLLGLPAIQALHVLAQVDGISTPIPEQYLTSSFRALGLSKGIATPFSLSLMLSRLYFLPPAMSLYP